MATESQASAGAVTSDIPTPGCIEAIKRVRGDFCNSEHAIPIDEGAMHIYRLAVAPAVEEAERERDAALERVGELEGLTRELLAILDSK